MRSVSWLQPFEALVRAPNELEEAIVEELREIPWERLVLLRTSFSTRLLSYVERHRKAIPGLSGLMASSPQFEPRHRSTSQKRS